MEKTHGREKTAIDYGELAKCERCNNPIVLQGGLVCLGTQPFPWKKPICSTCVNTLVKHLELRVVLLVP